MTLPVPTEASGETFIGQQAWQHLEAVAGEPMFLRLYVHTPIQSLLKAVPDTLAPITMRTSATHLYITIGDDTLTISRNQT